MPYRFNFHTKKSDYYERSVDVTTAGLVLAMNFNPETLFGPAGSEVVLDSSGCNNHGQNYGATAVSNGGLNNGNALNFDGVNDYIEITNESNFDFEYNQPVSFSFWLKRSVAISGNEAVFQKFHYGAPWRGWDVMFKQIDTGEFNLRYYNDGITEGDWFQVWTDRNMNDLVDDQWHHYVITYDGTRTEAGVNFYIDGNIEAKKSIISGGNSSILNNFSLQIGAFWGGQAYSESFLKGILDEPRIYKRVLTADEAKQLYLQRKEIHNSFVSQKNIYVDNNGNVAVNKTEANASLDVNGFILHNGKLFVSTQFDKTADTTLTDIPGLLVILMDGYRYKFTVNLFVNADATGGHKYAMSGEIGILDIIYQINSISNTTNLNVINSRHTLLDGSAGQAGATVIHTVIEGFIAVSIAGFLTCQFGQQVASGTSSVLVGSNMIVEQIL